MPGTESRSASAQSKNEKIENGIRYSGPVYNNNAELIWCKLEAKRNMDVPLNNIELPKNDIGAEIIIL